MSNEHRAVYAEASLPNGLTATLLPGHVAVFSDMSTTPAKHLGTARWHDTKFKDVELRSRDIAPEDLVALGMALEKAIPKPWRVFVAEVVRSGRVRFEGMNMWTGGLFYWSTDGDSFDPKFYQTSLYDWTHATIDPEARTLLTAWGVTLP